MKHYETHFDDYVQSAEKCSLHPELDCILANFPSDALGNLIVYGPSGVGKYTQVLRILKKYSPSQLKYDKKVTLSIKKQSKKMMASPIPTATIKKNVSTATVKPSAAASKKPAIAIVNEKQCFSITYRISDIHFEIDMSLLGCNSKQVWHELYLQIMDIVAIRPVKRGIIVCKNFHAIHSELLDNFYSYVQSQELFRSRVELVYVLITEHLSFIPNQLMDRFAVLSVGRPTTDAMISTIAVHRGDAYADAANKILSDIGSNENILNMKELFSFGLVQSVDALPRDNFNIICDSLIEEMESIGSGGTTLQGSGGTTLRGSSGTTLQGSGGTTLQGSGGTTLQGSGQDRTSTHVMYFRDALYDILIYGLDAMECVWYVSRHYIEQHRIPVQRIPGLMAKIHEFSHQYGNNYRAIFHLEFVFLYILQCIEVNVLKPSKDIL
jgi:hypothetical protein